MKYSRFRINICHIYFVDRHFVSSLNCTNWSKSCGTKIWKIIILTEALKWWFVSWVLSSYDLQRFLMLLLSSYSRAMDNNSNITKPLLKLGKNPSRNTEKRAEGMNYSVCLWNPANTRIDVMWSILIFFSFYKHVPLFILYALGFEFPMKSPIFVNCCISLSLSFSLET